MKKLFGCQAQYITNSKKGGFTVLGKVYKMSDQQISTKI